MTALDMEARRASANRRVVDARARFGVLTIQTAPYVQLRKRWHAIEEQNWDAIWIGDHTSAQYPRTFAYEAWTLMGALARETERVRIGTLVSSATLRHPAMTAMSVVTVDHCSNGRLDFGIGSGGFLGDARAVGRTSESLQDRLARLEAQLAIIAPLLSGLSVDTHSGSYASTSVVAQPLQRPRPPMIVAAEHPKALRIAARYGDGWTSVGGGRRGDADASSSDLSLALGRMHEQLRQFDEACAVTGRDPRSLRKIVLVHALDVFKSADYFEEVSSLYLEAGVDELAYYWPMDWRTLRDDIARVAVMHRVARDVLPRLRAAYRARKRR